MSDKLQIIQILRGFAALLVVFAHAIDFSSQHDSNQIPFILKYGYLENFGAIGVDLFFIISGFVMTLSITRFNGRQGARQFILLRLARLAPLYWLFTIFIFELLIYGSGLTYDLLNRLFNALIFIPVFEKNYTMPLLDVGWTLSFEFTYYVILCASILNKKPIIISSFFILVMVILGVIFKSNVFIVNWFSNPIFLEFLLGSFAYTIYTRFNSVTNKKIILIGFIFSLFCFIFQLAFGFGEISESKNIVNSSLSWERFLIWGIPAFLFFIYIVDKYKIINKSFLSIFLITLGDASYSIYLTHTLAFNLINKILDFSGFTMNPGFFMLVLVVTSTIIGFVVYKILEQPFSVFFKIRLKFIKVNHSINN